MLKFTLTLLYLKNSCIFEPNNKTNIMIIELNGIKYLLVEAMITERNHKQLENICKKYDCINQGIKKIDRDGFWSGTYAIINILVPEKNIIQFNNEEI